MAQDSGGEKSLPASGQKKQRARQEGNVPRSQDLSSAVVLFVALLGLYSMGGWMLDDMVNMGRYYMGHAHELLLKKTPIQSLALRAMLDFALCTAPFLLLMLVSGLALNVAQVGFMFTTKPLQPNFNKLNFISGLGRFVSMRSAVELIKSLLKLTAATYMVWLALRSRLPDFIALMDVTPDSLLGAVATLVVAVWWRIALAMLIIGILDYGFQYWHYERDLRMTREEAREEAKEMEGDPHIKRRIRQLQRQIATQRMMKEVPKADVIITNPTHFAVALRYDMAEMNAPTVVAKGARLVAQRIRDIAVENDVPIVQRPELARTLFQTIQLGQTIPEALFHTVAEVLSFVYSIDRRAEKVRERRTLITVKN
jgi:flagellar biosynthetic protein FlhB